MAFYFKSCFLPAAPRSPPAGAGGLLVVRRQRGEGQELGQAEGLAGVGLRVQRQLGGGGDASHLGVVQRRLAVGARAQQREATQLEASRATCRRSGKDS